jgi:lipoprotein signal peptidase
VILGLLGTIWGVAGLITVYMGLAGSLPVIFVAISGTVSILFSILCLTGFWGLLKRKVYGRWVAVAGLSFIAFGGIMNSFAAFDRYPGPAKSLAAFAVGVIVFGPIGFLAYRLARGERANAFFSGTHHRATENTEDTEKEFQQDGQD